MAKNKYTDIEDDSAWKTKYFNSLEDLEKKETEWNESEKILRTLITYLSNAADNSYPKLTKQVQVLEKTISSGVSPLKLRKAIDEIDVTVSELRGLREQSKNPVLKQVYAFIKQLSPAGDIEKKVRKIEQKVVSANSDRLAPALLTDLAKLLVTGLQVTAKQQKKGILSTFLGDKEKSDKKSEDIKNQNNEQAEDDEAILDDQLSEAIEALSQILERMILPSDLQVEANLVKRKIQQESNANSFIKGLESTLDIVCNVLSRIKKEKQDIEEFLKQLTERLHEMDSDLINAGKLRLLSNQQGHSMSDAVKKEMIDMEAGMKRITDIEELKTSVQSSVVLLRNHVDNFILDEDKQNKESEKLIAKLKSKVSDMEKESNELKQQLENERAQTLRDTLTGVPNRLAYEERFDSELARFHRKGEKFILVVWDIDHFKNINDTYGHASGDKVLKVVANILSSQLRETDFFARYGGEEFVSILPDTDMVGAKIIVDKLRESVAVSEFHFRDTPVTITLSCGFAEISDKEGKEELFVRADKALYKAKKSGRNKCQPAS